MTFEIRPVKPEELHDAGSLFTAHLREQFSIDSFHAPNPAFDPHSFIRAMMNPPVNHIVVALQDGKIIGFARLGVLFGEGLLPLDPNVKVDRTDGVYLKRLPVILLGKLKNLIEKLIARFESIKSVSRIVLPMKRGYLADIYVLPEMRGKGAGQELVDAALKWFSSRGVSVVELSYLWKNENGKNFWMKNGFENYRATAKKTI